MRRFTSMKVGLASILSCLALFLGLFATTGTASAHTARHIEPTISVFDVSREGSDCVSFNLEGQDFTPRHRASLFAETRSGFNVNIDPDRVRINRHGNFSTDVQVCGFGGFSSCGDFIDNPDFFCGVNLNPEEFCGFNFEPSEFCFGQQFQCQFQCQFPGQVQCQFPGQVQCQFPGQFQCQFPAGQFQCQFPGQFSGGCERFRCGFRHIPVVEFCRFHDFSFCFFHRHRSLTVFITAEDDHTGIDSNTVAIRAFRLFNF